MSSARARGRPAAATVAAIAVAAVAAPGCGDDERSAEAPRPVRLVLTAPGDGAVVEGEAVQVSGTVAPPGAQVRVRGRPAEVAGGRFELEVPLDPGTNLIDVTASADGRRPSLAALRVTRRMPVEIPDVDGEDPDTAVARLEALGLRPRVTEGGGLLDDLLPGSVGVCSTEPGAGETAMPGSLVEVEVAKVC